MNKEKSTTLTPSNQDTVSQTPIEIALQIDKNGMTTASKLYSFLELDKSHFSRWCNKNIIKNKFATENVDYIVLATDGEKPIVLIMDGENPLGGRPKTDYKLTSDFAKKLSMTGNTERHEQARQYFIACEQGLKIATQKLESANNIDMKPLIDALTTLTVNMSAMQQDIHELKQTQGNRYLLEKKYPSAWYKKINPKFKMITEYFGCSRKELYLNIYKELEDTYDIDINQIYEDYCYENNLLKDECYPMDSIEHNTQLRDALTLLIDSSLVKYGLQTEEEIKNFKRTTIFDREVTMERN